jgi:sulfur carrier protein ThiS
MTVADLLADIDGGDHYAVVRVGDEYISRPNFGRTKVPDGAQVYLIPMIAGG